MKTLGLLEDSPARLLTQRFVIEGCFPISKADLMLETCSIGLCTISMTPPAPELLLPVKDMLVHQGRVRGMLSPSGVLQGPLGFPWPEFARGGPQRTATTPTTFPCFCLAKN